MVGLLDHSSEFRVITVQFLDAGICWTACRPIFITLSSSFKFAVSSNFFFCPLLIHFFSDSNLFCTFCSSSSQDTCHSGSPSSALSSKPLRATSSESCITCLVLGCCEKKGEQLVFLEWRLKLAASLNKQFLVFLRICGAVNWRP